MLGSRALLLAVAAYCINLSACHSCVHEEILKRLDSSIPHADRHLHSTSAQEYETFHDHHGRRLQGVQYNNIRIRVDTSYLEAGADEFACTHADQLIYPTLAETQEETYQCQAGDVLDDAKRAFIKNTLVPAALDFLQYSLSVVPVQGNLTLNNPWPQHACAGVGYAYRLMCCNAYWPTRYRNGGAGAVDYVLILTGRPTSGNTLAWAIDCMSDQISRPIAGHANLSPIRVSSATSQFQYQLGVLIHEIMHALGFSSGKMNSFRRPGTVQQVSSSSEVTSTGYDSVLQKRVVRMITPKVVAAAKSHYGCYEWPNAGMELEDGGEAGTAGSHWEKRVAMYEIMNGQSERVLYRSAITLAYFDDSGWYSVNYDRAEKLPWGNGEGCAFVTKRCNTWDSRYFCSKAGESGCTSDMRYVGYCTYTTDATQRPPSFQYFGSATAGGASYLSDYCPYYQGYENRDCTDPSTVAFFAYGEKVGTGSRCFSGTFQRAAVVSAPTLHGTCLATQCDPATNLLTVTLPGNPAVIIRCPRNGGTIDLSPLSNAQYVGTLKCPRGDLVCAGDVCGVNDCGGNGVCKPSDGTCTCNSGFYGSDEYSCNLRVCPLGTDNVECSGNGLCNPLTGQCEDGRGLVGCYDGWNGAACSTRGCPVSFSPRCTETACECAGFGTCVSGSCDCEAGFAGTGCQYTACPSVQGDRCSGELAGTCDGRTGFCGCFDITTGSMPHYFEGPACEKKVNGTRSLPQIILIVNNGSNTADAAFTVNAVAKQTYFAHVLIPDANYRVTVYLRANVSADHLRLTASFEGGSAPTASIGDYIGSATGQVNEIMIDLRPTTAINPVPFRAGKLIVALACSVPAALTVRARRDGCSALKCMFGRCSDGACICDAGWTGRTCEIPDCPGTPDCGGRGACTSSHCYKADGSPSRSPTEFCLPLCSCNSEYFTGAACETVSIQNNVAPSLAFRDFSYDDGSGRLVALNVGSKGSAEMSKTLDESIVTIVTTLQSGDVEDFQTVAVIDPKEFGRHITGSFGVYMKLNFSSTPEADAILIGAENIPPAIALIGQQPVQYDSVAWRLATPVQEFAFRFANNQNSTLYFARVINGRYAKTRLSYTFTMEIAAGICPPSLQNCSGNGICDDAAFSCRCDRGFAGIRCHQSVVELLGNESTSVIVKQPPGEWSYLYVPLKADDVQFNLTFMSADRAMRPILAAAFEQFSHVQLLDAVTSETAMVDFMRINSISQTSQSLLVRRKATDSVLLIGILNSPNSRVPLSGELSMRRHTAAVTSPCTSTDVGCMRKACHDHGIFLPESRRCRCDLGWNDRADCASPMFSSLQKLMTAAQHIEPFCSVCSKTVDMPSLGDMAIWVIPQTLQKSTTLRLTVSSVGQNGSAAIFISFNLPRSLLDFAYIASGGVNNESIVLDKSATGVFVATIMAHTPGVLHIGASRNFEAVPPAETDSFSSRLRGWMIGTPQGKAVIVFGAFMVVAFTLGCILQGRARRANERARATIHEAFAAQLKMLRLKDQMEQAMNQHGDEAFQDKPALRKFMGLSNAASSRDLPRSTSGRNLGAGASSRNLPTNAVQRPLSSTGQITSPYTRPMLVHGLSSMRIGSNNPMGGYVAERPRIVPVVPVLAAATHPSNPLFSQHRPAAPVQQRLPSPTLNAAPSPIIQGRAAALQGLSQFRHPVVAASERQMAFGAQHSTHIRTAEL